MQFISFTELHNFFMFFVFVLVLILALVHKMFRLEFVSLFRRKPAHWISQVLKLASLQMQRISWNEGNIHVEICVWFKFNLHCPDPLSFEIHSTVFPFCAEASARTILFFIRLLFYFIFNWFYWTIFNVYLKSHWNAHTLNIPQIYTVTQQTAHNTHDLMKNMLAERKLEIWDVDG